MKKIALYILVILTSANLNAQETLSDLLKLYNKNKINYISVQELSMPKTGAIILDARELEEFNVSHIKDAFYVGYDNFKIETLLKNFSDKNQKIAVYCSIGIRSEEIAFKLKKAGYNNVFNLYGGIFEWKNNGFKVYDSEEKETENVHVSSKYWAKWLIKGNKVY